MTEVIQWAKLTPEQKNRLVAEKVMGWKEKECPGEMRDYSYGWECTHCSLSGNWDGKAFNEFSNHSQNPPQYIEDMDEALTILERFPEVHIFYLKQRAQGRYRVIVEEIASSYVATMNSLNEAICIAALRARGIEVL